MIFFFLEVEVEFRPSALDFPRRFFHLRSVCRVLVVLDASGVDVVGVDVLVEINQSGLVVPDDILVDGVDGGLVDVVDVVLDVVESIHNHVKCCVKCFHDSVYIARVTSYCVLLMNN